MFFRFFCFCAVFSALSLHAETAPLSGGLDWGTEEGPPPVLQTGRFQVIPDAGRDPFVSTPRGSQAAQMTATQKVFDWKPSPDPTRAAGGAHLLSFALSPDESVFAVLERVGTNAGPHGSRILLFNLFNGFIINGFEFQKQALRSLWFLPAGNRILAVEEGQEVYKSATRLLLIQPRTGKVSASSAPLAAPPVSLLFHEDRIYYKLPGDPFLYYLSCDSLSAVPESYRTRQEGGILFLSPDGKTLVNGGDKLLEFIALDEERPLPRRVGKLAESFIPAAGVAVAEAGNAFLLVSGTGEAALWLGDVLRSLGKGARAIVDWNASSKLSLIVWEKNSAMTLHSLPQSAGSASATIVPGKIPPVTSGEIVYAKLLTAEEDAVLAVDNRGTLMRLARNKNRWTKEVLFPKESAKPIR